jgi:hypothetical protein
MLGQGQECYVSVRPNEVPPGSARLTEKNSLRLEEGAKIRIIVSGKTLFLTVIKRVECSEDKDKDNITIGDAIGGDAGGFYKKVSPRTFAWHKAWGTRKARWSAGGYDCFHNKRSECFDLRVNERLPRAWVR